MTEVVYHTYTKTGKNSVHHSYIIDIGTAIDIQQVMEYTGKIYDSVFLKPPHPKTRYFELVITVYLHEGNPVIDDLQVYPVLTRKKPDFRIFGFLIRRGDWIITERIYKKENTTETQWIYTDDFHLFAITHAEDTLDHMVEKIVAKIDEIATSVKTGYRINSHRENQRMRREAFDAVMEKQGGITLNKTAILNHPEFQLIAELGEGDRWRIQDDILQDLVARGATLDTFRGFQYDHYENKYPGKIGYQRTTHPDRRTPGSQLAF